MRLLYYILQHPKSAKENSFIYNIYVYMHICVYAVYTLYIIYMEREIKRREKYLKSQYHRQWGIFRNDTDSVLPHSSLQANFCSERERKVIPHFLSYRVYFLTQSEVDKTQFRTPGSTWCHWSFCCISTIEEGAHLCLCLSENIW